MNEKLRRRSLRFGLRTLLIFVTLAAPTLAYVASYYRLSRRGMADAEPWGSEDWVYVSAAETESKGAQALHLKRARLYAPLSYLDNRLLGTPAPSLGWMEGMTEASD